MRVGIVTGSYTPRLGGAVTHSNLIVQALAKEGHTAEIFCPDLDKQGQFLEKGIVVNRVRVRAFTARLQVVAKLRGAVQARRDAFDVFISPEYNSGALALALSQGTRTMGIYGADVSFEAANLHRKKPIPYETILKSRGGVLGLLQRFLLKRLSCTIALNQFDACRLRRHTPKIANVGCWVDTPASNKAPAGQPKLATIIGRSVCWKRIERAYAIAREIQQHYPGMQIHYYGDRPMKLPGMRDYSGQPNHAVLSALEESDLTVNMSEYETYCITNLEVMASRSLLLVQPLPQYDYLTELNCIQNNWSRRAIEAFTSGQVGNILAAAQRTVEQEHKNAKQLVSQMAKVAGLQTSSKSRMEPAEAVG